MIDLFDLADVNRSAAAINTDKLLWLNQHYLRQCDSGRLAPLLARQLTRHAIDFSTGPALESVCEIQKERVKTLDEMAVQSRYFYKDFQQFDEQAAHKHLRPVVLVPLEEVLASLQVLEEWTAERLHGKLEEVATRLEVKLGKIAQPLRVAVTGGAVSPSIDITLALVGRDRTLKRMVMALDFIRQRGSKINDK
jgi:glutamyl-tRNA synthetase